MSKQWSGVSWWLRADPRRIWLVEGLGIGALQRGGPMGAPLAEVKQQPGKPSALRIR